MGTDPMSVANLRNRLSAGGVDGPLDGDLLAAFAATRNEAEFAVLLGTSPQAAANYLGPMMAKWQARKEGFDDIVMLDEHGHLSEAPTLNVFVVDAQGTLRTPGLDEVLRSLA